MSGGHNTTSTSTTESFSDSPQSKLSLLDIIIRLTIEQKVSSKIFLVNGIKLEGRVIGIDDTSILFQKERAPAFVVSRAAIASFLPDTEVRPE